MVSILNIQTLISPAYAVGGKLQGLSSKLCFSDPWLYRNRHKQVRLFTAKVIQCHYCTRRYHWNIGYLRSFPERRAGDCQRSKNKQTNRRYPCAHKKLHYMECLIVFLFNKTTKHCANLRHFCLSQATNGLLFLSFSTNLPFAGDKRTPVSQLF